MIYKSSSNFKSIGWKLRILEIPPTVSCWPLAYVDLLVYVDLKNNWLVEFSALKFQSSSNFESIRWKLTILEIRPMLTFRPMWTVKTNWWMNSVTWLGKSSFKFQVNQMKIEDFRNTTEVVDLGPMLTFWSMLTSKGIGHLNSVTWNINPLQISSQSDEIWGF